MPVPSSGGQNRTGMAGGDGEGLFSPSHCPCGGLEDVSLPVTGQSGVSLGRQSKGNPWNMAQRHPLRCTGRGREAGGGRRDGARDNVVAAKKRQYVPPHLTKATGCLTNQAAIISDLSVSCGMTVAHWLQCGTLGPSLRGGTHQDRSCSHSAQDNLWLHFDTHSASGAWFVVWWWCTRGCPYLDSVSAHPLGQSTPHLSRVSATPGSWHALFFHPRRAAVPTESVAETLRAAQRKTLAKSPTVSDI